MPVYPIQSDRAAEAFVGSLWRRLLTIVATLCLTVIISTIGFVALGRHEQGSFDHRVLLAFWDTLNLVSTVGNIEEEMTVGQRVWAMFVITFGLGAVLYGFGLAQALIHGGFVPQMYARRRMQRTLRQMSDHIIVCGYGRVGRSVAREVRSAGTRLVAIEQNEEAAQQADHDGHLVVHADCEKEDALREAGVERAAGLIAALGEDASNVYLILTARELNPKLRVVAIAQDPEACSQLTRAGADRAIAATEMAALQLSHLILKPRVSDFIAAAVGEGEFDFAEIAVDKHPTLIGKRLSDLPPLSSDDAIVVSVVDADGDHVFNPRTTRELKGGDTLILVCRGGTLDHWSEFA